MFDQMKKLMEMKKQADMIKRQLDATIIDVDAGLGIKIKVNGSQQFQTIDIDAEKIKPENKIRLETDLLKSLNAAMKKSQEEAALKMKSLLPGGFPGL
ncbi:MAG TPA: YbaB/EbfC family nucleoid-associated protein [Candidatus Omnitrophota bacterium]|nr:YbaB/EbfC family nucleoid-associated protein [Candidatus Omnitrophota bacterium]